MFNNFNSFIYNLTIEQRVRFNIFLQSLKDDCMQIAYSDINHHDVTIDELIEDINSITEYEKIRDKQELAASKDETTISQDRWGVHKTHCCLKHGCKYGDPDCPVILSLIEQKYPCEFCE